MGERKIVINPVTRIEGHAKVTITLDTEGAVSEARLHVTQFRGFEKLCEGRPFTEMPSLMARVCGICPVSHLIAGAKACDALMAIRIPEIAADLRRILHLAQLVQSHALSFFYLSSPDFLLGMDAPPEKRNIIGMLAERPELARDGIRLRQIGQQMIGMLAGDRIHPAWIVAGGVSKPMDMATRDAILKMIPEGLAIAERAIAWFRGISEKYHEEARFFANFPSFHMGLVSKDGTLEHYDGLLRIINPNGKIVAEADPATYADLIGEAVEPDSYLKTTYYRPLGYPEGVYRVGPLSRLNVAEKCGTPKADRALEDFRLRAGSIPIHASFSYHGARLIEIINALERIERILDSPDITSRQVRAYAKPNSPEGIGVAEAPRGTLIHHYLIDDDGLIRWANLIIATGHNNAAMNRGILQAAHRFVKGAKVSEGALNRVEAVIRAFDPCLSCSTHAMGEMPLVVQLVDATGRVLDEKRR